jgi:hypothetical protein
MKYFLCIYTFVLSRRTNAPEEYVSYDTLSEAKQAFRKVSEELLEQHNQTTIGKVYMEKTDETLRERLTHERHRIPECVLRIRADGSVELSQPLLYSC